MIKRILVPIDGSDHSTAATQWALELAAALKAELLLLNVTPPFVFPEGFEYMGPVDLDVKVYEKACREAAQRMFEPLLEKASAVQVAAKSEFVLYYSPGDTILEVAKAQQCDMIVIAPHGRGGVKGWLLGSVTQRVLAKANVPVLVHRGTA